MSHAMPVSNAPSLGKARVISSEEVMPDTFVLRLESRALSRARPGQFVHIRTTPTWDPILRRPMSIYLIHDDGASVLVRDVGRGSGLITQRRPGDELDVLGPLGRPFALHSDDRHVLMVGGGYGVAPLLGLAIEALAVGQNVSLLVGAATASYVFPQSRVPAGLSYLPATMDGSLGHRGFVTELLPALLGDADRVYACGPTPMLEAVHRVCASQTGLQVEVSMEQQMGCAMGVCLGCVIPTERGYKRVCRDGPVFDSAEVRWGTWNDL